MDISIKNLKHSQFASQETHCFQCTVYIDEKKAFQASNNGFGGPNDYHVIKGGIPNDQLWTRIEKINANLKSLPDLDIYSDGKYLVEQCLETVIGNLINEALIWKDIKHKISKKTVAFIPSKHEIYTWNYRFNNSIKKQVKAKYPDAQLVNEMSQNDAINLWRSVGV